MAGAPPPSPSVATPLTRLAKREHARYSFIPDWIPSRLRQELISELEELEMWAASNAKDARRDTFRFWGLKIPAILASSFAGVFGYFDLQAATVLSGSIGSVCVVIDGLNPGGRLRNTHMRAVHDLRQVQDKIKSQLRYAVPSEDSPESLITSISQLVQAERQRIGAYLMEAESVLGETK